MQLGLKLGTAVILFLVGSNLVISSFYKESLDVFGLAVGVIILLITYPLCYYFYAKYKSNHRILSDEEILNQAKIESKSLGELNDKK
jgi:hypothetical protein